ncbi:MAG: 16S rRNA (cytidine1402-2'-O)-methyltransferase [Candidatus Poriferisodalaceae bacterium]|jgi:16S rRNA (cytidine1402-2'-O)-methyltransferase|nr:16S rRNA (cytidine(1402)-2'-O)-methyltransferase [Acidimicrobiales bacterium]|tara:strand:- start:2535 stop:3368 length:834 start_codon:yes stop_codon:yes gene_type:complete
MSGSGILYLIATPIGNLSDITYRAVETLRSLEVLACEDTRRTGRLLKHLGIHVNRLIIANSHTEAHAAAEIVELLKQGINVGLVTDAGMPGISDPGERVANAVIESGEKLTVIPGSSAPVSALVVSGLSADRYVMEGFLPRKGKERSHCLERIAIEESTSVMLESPKRIGATLDELADICGKSRKAVVVRELTKLHEEISRGSLEELSEKFKDGTKGEIVLLVSGASPPETDDSQILVEIKKAKDQGLSRRDAIDVTSGALKIAHNRVYELALTIDF